MILIRCDDCDVTSTAEATSRDGFAMPTGWTRRGEELEPYAYRDDRDHLCPRCTRRAAKLAAETTQ